MKYMIEKIENTLTKVDVNIVQCKRSNPPEFVLYDKPWWYNPLQLVGIILFLTYITFCGDDYE